MKTTVYAILRHIISMPPSPLNIFWLHSSGVVYIPVNMTVRGELSEQYVYLNHKQQDRSSPKYESKQIPQRDSTFPVYHY
jgi:hypothetical protein